MLKTKGEDDLRIGVDFLKLTFGDSIKRFVSTEVQLRPLIPNHVIFRYLPTTQKLNRRRIKGYESAKDKFNGSKYSPWYKRFEVGRYYKLEHHAASESVPEMVPQLVVPDLTDCDLKPYVSYRTTDIYQVRTIFNGY